MSRTFSALRSSNYRLYATGTLISHIGTWMQRVAQDWLVLVLTGSGAALGVTAGLQFLPLLLVSPIAGVIADRYPKRRTLMITQSAMGVVAATLGTLTISGVIVAWHVYTLSFLFGVASALDTPTRQIFVNELVEREDVANAVALSTATFQVGRMLGPAIGGLMIALFGADARATGWVILVNAASYGAVLLSLRRLRRAASRASAPLVAARGQVRAGLAYIRSRKDLLLVIAVAFCVGTFGMNLQVTVALMATDTYDRGPGEYGVLGSMLAVGSLGGSILAARRERVSKRMIVLSACCFGAVEAICGLMPTYLTFAAALPVCGVFSLTTFTGMMTYVQLNAVDEMRGRVMAIFQMTLMGGTAISAPLFGLISDRFGARWTLICGGSLTWLGTLGVTSALTLRHGRRPLV